MQTPRDFVREPATWCPIQVPGRATFRELVDVLADQRTVALVAARDPEMGPYTACITVAAAEADAASVELDGCSRRYRHLRDDHARTTDERQNQPKSGQCTHQFSPEAAAEVSRGLRAILTDNTSFAPKKKRTPAHWRQR